MNQDARDLEAKINEIRSGPTILPTQLYVAIAIVRTQTRGFEPSSQINFRQYDRLSKLSEWLILKTTLHE